MLKVPTVTTDIFGNIQNLISPNGQISWTPESPLMKLKRLSKNALASNPRTSIMSSPPTIVANGTTAPAGQSNVYFHSVFPSFARVYGGTLYTNGSFYGRIKAANIGSTGGNIGANDGSQASYSRIEFMADANMVTILVGRSTAPYRFLVNDQYCNTVGTNTLLGTPTSTAEYISLDFTSVGGRAIRKITIEMQGDNSFQEVHVGTTETIFQSDNSDVLRSVLLGDSYCAGSDATALGDGFGAVMADWLGIRSHMNSGSSGTGWTTSNSAYTFNQRIINGDLGLNGTPDLIFLMGSYNDRSNTPATITSNVLIGLTSARTQYPNVPIFVFGVFPANTGPSNGIIAAETAVASAVTSFNDSRVRFIPVSTDSNGAWITGTGLIGTTTGIGNSDIYTDSGGVHPPTAGHAYLGKRAAIAVQIAAAGMY